MSESTRELLNNNLTWAKNVLSRNPDFFNKLSKGQSPKFLWIGCSDSRVSPKTITQAPAGSIFVHRNIANMVIHSDTNLMCVVYFAVNILKVEHIIVCGHYGCGGIQAALENTDFGLMNEWINEIRTVYVRHKGELDTISESNGQIDRLAELNVLAQVENLKQLLIDQKIGDSQHPPIIHGWVFNLRNGLIQELT